MKIRLLVLFWYILGISPLTWGNHEKLQNPEEISVTSSVPNPIDYEHKADYLVITCIDFRLMDEVVDFMQKRGLKDKYDHLIFPGASLGAISTEYPSWQEAFFSQLSLITKMHGTKDLIVIDHRDCGMYKHVYGMKHVKDFCQETELHRQKMVILKKEVLKRHPNLTVELLLMGVDGKIEKIEETI